MPLQKFVKNSRFHIVINTGNKFSPFLKCFLSFKMSFSTFESQLHHTLQNFSIDLIEQFIVGYALTLSKTWPCFYLSAVHVFLNIKLEIVVRKLSLEESKICCLGKS